MSTSNTAQDEVVMLRVANAELTEKSRTRKTKITELEAQVSELAGKIATTETALLDATLGTPLRQLAATVSAVPELWAEQFQKHFKLELRDGKLLVLDKNSEPVMDGEGPLLFTPDAISKFVTADNRDDLEVFRHITVGSLASGGGANNYRADTSGLIDIQKQKTPKYPSNNFGLR